MFYKSLEVRRFFR